MPISTRKFMACGKSALAMAIALLVTQHWSAPVAEALTLANRGAVAARITLIKGADRTMHTIAAAGTLSDVCAQGCILKLEDGSEWLLDGSERVSIERALVYYDGPERPPAPAATSTPPPADTRGPRAPSGAEHATGRRADLHCTETKLHRDVGLHHFTRPCAADDLAAADLVIVDLISI